MQILYFLKQHCSPYAIQIIRLCAWLIVLTVVLAPLERLFALHPQKFFRKEIAVDLGYYFLGSLISSVVLSVPLALIAREAHSLLPKGFITIVAAWPLWARMMATFVIGDLGFYWGHRWSHAIPLLWGFHAIHHSAEHIDFLVNTRVHPVDLVFTRLCGLVPLYVVGLAAPAAGSTSVLPLLVLLLGTAWGFFLHANVRWRFGKWELLIATPAFHHWHHTNDDPAYFHKNFAPMLPWIDHVFGTLYLPHNRHPQRYGIDQLVSKSMAGQLLHPFLIHSYRNDAKPRQNSPNLLPKVDLPENTMTS